MYYLLKTSSNTWDVFIQLRKNKSSRVFCVGFFFDQEMETLLSFPSLFATSSGMRDRLYPNSMANQHKGSNPSNNVDHKMEAPWLLNSSNRLIDQSKNYVKHFNINVPTRRFVHSESRGGRES